jgi:glycogen debranching enzyme
MSYHNGSIWPHDNALIAYGMARYGFKEMVLRIMEAFFDASIFLDLHRLPELLCGFDRRPGQGPTLYPVACSPQSWSAAAVFLLLQASLGLDVNSRQGTVCFIHSLLPPTLRELRINNLTLQKGSVDLLLQRHGDDVGINVVERRGKVEIRMVK